MRTYPENSYETRVNREYGKTYLFYRGGCNRVLLRKQPARFQLEIRKRGKREERTRFRFIERGNTFDSVFLTKHDERSDG